MRHPNCIRHGHPHPMVLRINERFGTEFWGCELYPKCRYTVGLHQKSEEEIADIGAYDDDQFDAQPRDYGDL